MPKVSVIIPTYNRAKKIVRSINSVLNQTYEDFELIIVDDCSTDSTKEVIETIPDKRIRYVCLETNGGAARARNCGVKIALGEYIAFQDSDDEWLSDKLEKQMSYIEKNPEFAMVYGKMHVISSSEEGDFPNSSVEGDLEGDIYSWLLCRNTIGAPTMFVKKDCFIAVGGFDDSLKCLEDWEYAIRFSKEYKIGYIDSPLMIVHSEMGGVSSNLAGYYEARCKMVAAHKEDLQQLGIFDDVVMDIFSKAQARGILTQVQTLMIKMLQI